MTAEITSMKNNGKNYVEMYESNTVHEIEDISHLIFEIKCK